MRDAPPARRPPRGRGLTVLLTALLLAVPPLSGEASAAGNRLPTARPDAHRAEEDARLIAGPARSVLRNDRDPEGGRLVARLVAAPQHGDLELRPDGTFTYAPAPDYHGPDTFHYRACERDRRAACSRATEVGLTVSGVDDAPRSGADAYTAEEDAALEVDAPGPLANDHDPEGAVLEARLERGPEHGTLALAADGSFTYAPRADWTGEDRFLYRAHDGGLAGPPTEVRISVRPANDPPQARDDRATTAEDTAVEIPVLLNDSDPDPGDRLAVSGHGQPGHGTVSCGTSGCEYAPERDYHGPDAFTYRVTDGVATAEARVHVQVEPVDDPPVVRIDAYGARANAVRTVAAPGVLLNDSDPDGDALSVVTYNQPRHGQLTMRPDGSFTFRPDRDFVGTTSFTYGVSDGSGPAVGATVSLRVSR